MGSRLVVKLPYQDHTIAKLGSHTPNLRLNPKPLSYNPLATKPSSPSSNRKPNQKPASPKRQVMESQLTQKEQAGCAKGTCITEPSNRKIQPLERQGSFRLSWKLRAEPLYKPYRTVLNSELGC